MARDPAQDSTHLVQALAAIVNTCTNESSWQSGVSPLPIPLSSLWLTSGSTSNSTVAGHSYPLHNSVGFGLKPTSGNSGIIGRTTGRGVDDRGIGNDDTPLYRAALISASVHNSFQSLYYIC